MIIAIGCIIISLAFAPLGCVMLWQRYSYLSDGLIHSSMLAVVLHLIFNLPLAFTMPAVSIIFALMVKYLRDEHSEQSAVINVVSSAIVALSLLLCTIYDRHEDLHDLLAGDISTINAFDLIYLIVLLLCTNAVIFYHLPQIVVSSLNREIAAVQGTKPQSIELLLLLLTALLIAATLKLIGGLLISAMLIVPVMMARSSANTPLEMIYKSAGAALILSLLSLISWYYLNTPISAMIIVLGTLYLLVVQLLNKSRGAN